MFEFWEEYSTFIVASGFAASFLGAIFWSRRVDHKLAESFREHEDLKEKGDRQ